MTVTDQQLQWDQEAAQAFLARLRGQEQEVRRLQAEEDACRGAYREAVAARKAAEKDLSAAVAADPAADDPAAVVAYRVRLHGLYREREACQGKELGLRQQGRQLVRRRKEGQARLLSLIEADTRGLPLFDWARGRAAGAREETPAGAPAVPDPPPYTDQEQALRVELFAALHRVEGAAERWGALRVHGAHDAGLKAALGKEWEGGGGRSGPGLVGYWTEGKSRPRFWLGSQVGDGGWRKPDLQGKPLLEKVREVLGIPVPSREGTGGEA